jgi:hypothetical protein
VMTLSQAFAASMPAPAKRSTRTRSA